MEDVTTSNYPSHYNDMASFDFKKPINLLVTIEETCDDSLEKYTDRMNNTVKRTYNYIINTNKSRNISIKDNTTQPHVTQNNGDDNSMLNNEQHDPNHLSTQQEFSELSLVRNQNTISYVPVAGEVTSCSRENINYNVLYKQNVYTIDTLSKYFIRILRAYSYYFRIVNNSGADYSLLSTAKAKFRSVKHYYYCISRNIAIRELLPRRYNRHFVRLFLERTRYIAINEEKYFCSHEDVESIYNDFIMWLYNVEKRPQCKEPIYQETSIQAPNTAPDLPFSPALDSTRNYNTQVQQDKPSDSLILSNSQTCLFRYGKPGQEISINISTDTLNSVNRKNEIKKQEDTEIATQEREDLIQTSLNPIRSTSRDSGFRSPCNDVDLCVNTQENTYQQPTITNTLHVDQSIYPGSCRICNTNTSLMCLGCFEYYYCSVKCQNLDWENHKFICARNQSQ